MVRRSGFFFLLIAMCVCSAASAIVYVRPGGAGAQNGTSWDNAFASIQAAINTGPNVEIWVAAGTYVEYDMRIIGSPWGQPYDGIQLYGGFTVGMTSRSQRNWTVNQTILDGANTRRILTIV